MSKRREISHATDCDDDKTATFESRIASSRTQEAHLRSAIVKRHHISKPQFNKNEDIFEYPSFIACFTKSLPHSDDGVADEAEVLKMMAGVKKCKCYLNKINYRGELRLLNPSAIYSLNLIGPYKTTHQIPGTPLLTSKVVREDLIELYSMAKVRDLPFHKYLSSPLISEIPRTQSIAQLFRGETDGDQRGPYVSQLLYMTGKHYYYRPEINYLTEWDEFLKCQNGTVVGEVELMERPRHFITLRDGASYVHRRNIFEIANPIISELERLEIPKSRGIPQTKEQLYVDLGVLDLHEIFGSAVRNGMQSSWYHKWSSCKIRPEELGGLIYRKAIQLDVPIKSKLLPQAYPEGAPCSPSYPSSHAVTAGILTTLLKAFYDEDFMMPTFEPNEDGSSLIAMGSTLRLGDELDKLASNLALFRVAAGVNYRSDCVGIVLGEEIAISILQDYVLRYVQKVKFSFKRRNGDPIEISNDE